MKPCPNPCPNPKCGGTRIRLDLGTRHDPDLIQARCLECDTRGPAIKSPSGSPDDLQRAWAAWDALPRAEPDEVIRTPPVAPGAEVWRPNGDVTGSDRDDGYTGFAISGGEFADAMFESMEQDGNACAVAWGRAVARLIQISTTGETVHVRACLEYLIAAIKVLDERTRSEP